MLVVVAAVVVAALGRPACCDSDAVDVEFPLYTESWTPEKEKKVFKTFHLPFIASIQSFLTPFSPAPTIHQSDNSSNISDMQTHTLFTHTRFISVADGLKLLSCLR